jgi:hypothetical protein
MTNAGCFLAVFVGVSALASLVLAQSASEAVAQPLNEIVLLNNGRVLQGQVNRTFDQVHVQTAAGSRIVLQANRVDQIFDSLSAAFHYRGSKLGSDDIDGHLSLFHWCLKHRLKAEAQQQLDRLMQTQIDARQLQFLDRQLVRAFEPSTSAVVKNGRRNEPHRGVADKSLSSLDVDPVFHSLPSVNREENSMPAVMVDRAVAMASHTEPVKKNETKETGDNDFVRTKTKPSVLSQLDSMTELLTREDLHHFQRRVQPVLLKGCLAAKCHNSTATTMPLFHRGRGQLVPKRFTQRNLQTIVDWVDASQPADSSLVTQAVTAHGGQKSPGIKVGSKQFDLLTDWLRQVAKNSPELLPAAVVSEKSEPIDLVGLESEDAEALSVVQKTGRAVTGPSKERQAAKLERKQPEPVVDPFDPAAFNRLPK